MMIKQYQAWALAVVMVAFFSVFRVPTAWAFTESVQPVISEADWLANLIFQNECSSDEKKLLHWNEGEAFPSLGIGHFIWYPEGYNGPFTESFPKFLEYAESRGVELPEFLKNSPMRKPPWLHREDFFQDQGNGITESLRKFLVSTRAIQTEFLILRLQDSIVLILKEAGPARQNEIAEKFKAILAADEGLYVLVDYVNFNGEGINPKERYHGQGWGMLQVLERMEMDQIQIPRDAIVEFVRSAKVTMLRRVENSPPERNEQRWIPGWMNRMDGYLEVHHGGRVSRDEKLRQKLFATLNRFQ